MTQVRNHEHETDAAQRESLTNPDDSSSVPLFFTDVEGDEEVREAILEEVVGCFPLFMWLTSQVKTDGTTDEPEELALFEAVTEALVHHDPSPVAEPAEQKEKSFVLVYV